VVAVLKEDRYARSTLLRDPEGRLLVLKESVMRLPPGVRVPTLAAALARHEADLYEHLAGLPGIPRLVSRPAPDSFLRHWVPGATVRDTPTLPDGFFDALEGVLLGVHGRGVAYVDLAKEENVLIDESGAPWLVDFQISVARRGPLRPFVSFLQREDLYHLAKMRCRRRPDEARPGDRERIRRRGGLGRVHRATVKKAYNLLTRYLVTRWSGAGEGRPVVDPAKPPGRGAEQTPGKSSS
jgi:hypothetical protein